MDYVTDADEELNEEDFQWDPLEIEERLQELRSQRPRYNDEALTFAETIRATQKVLDILEKLH
jgi:hypothetical protein